MKTLRKPSRGRPRVAARKTVEVPPENSRHAKVVDTNCYLPTPEEISAACAEIRRTWQQNDERSDGATEFPTISVRDWNLTVDCSEF